MNPPPVKTPVVLILFNRPETTRAVLQAIALARPERLFVIADGPRPGRPEDERKCAEARDLINRIDWDCQVATDYAEVNLGLRKRVASGLNGVFRLVDKAIVLEDDCVPDPTFFPFCDELLERFQEDERVMAISGDNFQMGRQRTPYSYYFSRYNHCWGWATWRRAWNYYDDGMALWPLIRDGNWLEDVLEGDPQAVRYWTRIFQDVYDERIRSWAYRWTFACWMQGGLTALPNVNLVSNIGFAEDATNTSHRSRSSALATRPLKFPLRHPPFVVRDARADQFTQRNHFGTGINKRFKRTVAGILRSFGLMR